MAVIDPHNNMAEGSKEEGMSKGIGQAPSPDLVDKYLKLREGAVLEKLVRDSIQGSNQGGNQVSNQGDSLTAQIVTKAMQLNDNAAARAEQTIKLNNELIDRARKEADDTKQGMLTIVLGQIADIAKGLDRTREEIIKGNTPKNLTDIVNEAKAVHSVFYPEGNVKEKEVAPPIMDNKLQVEILRMQQDFQLQMRKFDLELEAMKSERALKMAQWEADNKFKREEYEDSKGRGKENMANFMDIAQSVAATVGSGGQPGIAQNKQHQVAAEADEADPGFTLDATAFPCQFCHELIEFPETGDKVACSNCGAKFDIKRHQNG